MVLTQAGSWIVDHEGSIVANMFFSVSIGIGLVVTLMMKAQLKRQNAIDS